MSEGVLTGYVPPETVAKAVSRSLVTLERWRRLRIGPPYYRVNRRVLYKLADVQAWVESSKREPLPKEAA